MRQQVAESIRQIQSERRATAEDRVRDLGLPIRVERNDGTVKQVLDLDEFGDPLYAITHNDQAAISTAANLLYEAPYSLSGSGLLIGMWDGGAGRSTHQEFSGGRMVIKDGASPIVHATHVGGTLAAAGVVARAKGMAFNATVHSYDWNDDKAEMTARAAATPGEEDQLYLSNHSYGFITGWYRTGGSSPAFIWYGSGTTADSIDPRFGQYNAQARDSDALAYNAPYYLMVRSAGNDRTDNPTAGQSVQLSPSSTTTVAYDPALHPAGDGVYRGGYDTIGFDSVAKNVLTVGSVDDAVTSGTRDLSKALMSAFSSWGPTDDGRIKPDVVANGQSLYSTTNGDTSYGSMSGTSMSAPNATGTAALLIEQYRQLFPGSDMLSSTLKGLLIHTADDLGNPGPDYRFGWGLINAQRAANLIRDHAAHPAKTRMTEEEVSTSVTSYTIEFVWDGVSPIRATLCWTDPAGTATTTSDLRSPRLRNNLDLRIIGPNNESFFPYVMPFVGTWTQESMSLPATTGINNTDNVEQVFIAEPPVAGVYRAVVTFQGTLTNNRQVFSLLLDGASGEEPPPPPLGIESVSPASAYSGGSITLELSGTALDTATDLRLVRDGFADLAASNLRLSSERLLGDVDLSNAAGGTWTVQVSSATETATLIDGFHVIGAIWSENFDGTVSGWSSEVVENHSGNEWTLTQAASHTPPTSYFAPAPATRTTTALQSPSIAIPEQATDLQLRFHHSYNLQNSRDGGRLYFSINGGTWTGVGDTGSGTVFASNGYTDTMRGGPQQGSYFDKKRAWTGNSGGFIETVVNLTDTQKFAGKEVRFRWILATDSSTASPGWYVDSIVLLGDGDLGNQPPQITQPASVPGAGTVTENEQVIYLVEAADAPVAVEATDDGGAENLTFTWSAAGPAPVFFLPNESSNAFSSTAWFEAPGDYTLTVAVTDSGGLTTTSAAQVRVLPVADSVQVDPASLTLRVGETHPFSATLLDQFNEPLADQPATFDWMVGGGGTIDSAGLFTASSAGGPFSISATHEAISGNALVTVQPGPASVLLSALEALYDGTPKEVAVTTDPEGLAVRVTYDGSETPPHAVGSYTVHAEVTDPDYEGSASGTLVISYDREAFDDWIASFGFTGEDADPDADPDGDGMSNWLEWRFGFDPSDPSSCLRIKLERSNGSFSLVINRVIDEGRFTLKGTTSLTDGTWDTVKEWAPTEREDDAQIELDPIPESHRFLRVHFLLNRTAEDPHTPSSHGATPAGTLEAN